MQAFYQSQVKFCSANYQQYDPEVTQNTSKLDLCLQNKYEYDSILPTFVYFLSFTEYIHLPLNLTLIYLMICILRT